MKRKQLTEKCFMISNWTKNVVTGTFSEEPQTIYQRAGLAQCNGTALLVGLYKGRLHNFEMEGVGLKKKCCSLYRYMTL